MNRKPYKTPTVTPLAADDPLVRATLRDICTCDAEPSCTTLDHDMDDPGRGLRQADSDERWRARLEPAPIVATITGAPASGPIVSERREGDRLVVDVVLPYDGTATIAIGSSEPRPTDDSQTSDPDFDSDPDDGGD